jgi:hypothetical protein
MSQSKSKASSVNSKNKPLGSRLDWAPPNPALGAQVNKYSLHER